MACCTVSVVVPFYNRSRFLPRLLTSIKEQALIPESIYIVDNGSSLEEIIECDRVIRNHRSTGLDITLVSTLKTGNANYARNLGLDLAETQYIAFLDSDDWWNPDHLLNAVTRLEQGDKSGVYSGAFIHLNGIREVRSMDVNDFDNPLSFLFDNKRGWAQTSSYVVNKGSLYNRVWWDEKLRRHQDIDFFLSVFFYTEGWGYLPVPTSHVDWDEGGTKQNLDFKSMIKFLKKWKMCFSEPALQRYACRQVQACVSTGAPQRYLKYYKRLALEASGGALGVRFLCSDIYLMGRQSLKAVVATLNLYPLLRYVQRRKNEKEEKGKALSQAKP